MSRGDSSVEFNQPPPPGKKKGGLGILPFLVIGIAIFVFMRGGIFGKKGPAEDPAAAPQPGPQRDVRLKPPIDPVEPAPKATTKGDWTIEEVETQPAAPSDSGVSLNLPQAERDVPKKTTKGDWSLEEVEEKPSQPDLRFPLPPRSPTR